MWSYLSQDANTLGCAKSISLTGINECLVFSQTYISMWKSTHALSKIYIWDHIWVFVTEGGEGTKTIKSSSDLSFAVALMFDCFEVNWRRRIFATNQCARQWNFCDACWPEVLCSKCFRIEAKYLFILKHHQTLLLPDLQEIHTGDCKQQLSESICYIGKTISAMCMGGFVLNIELPQTWLKWWYLHSFAILSFIPVIVISAMILTLLGMMPCRSCHVWTLLKPHQSRYFVYDGMPIISNVLIHCHERLKNFSVCMNFEITTLTWSWWNKASPCSLPLWILRETKSRPNPSPGSSNRWFVT